MYLTRYRARTKLTPQRIGIILILLSLVWGLYLMKIQLEERTSQPEYLKARIIELSREYIQALARAKNLDTTDGQVPRLKL
ncbi:Alpha-1,6-mannosylglycoprotein 6-beta-N-acetylglucosaminyltransferase A [Exaiptasia diaphana]|nr:Alpha-1,6-mannosylglycoprotein 6-beta-N-acetylglucosaminyltransferase A [Exaiptasia diaphana]